MDQNLLNQYASEMGRTAGGGMASPFLKLPQGIHRLRVIPGGNPVEPGIHFRKVIQHTAQHSPQNADFCVCWNFIAQNVQRFAVPLQKEGKLTPADVNLFQQHGCPFCRFHDYLGQHGADKDTLKGVKPQEMYLWNVLWRQPNGGQVAVWKLTPTKFKAMLDLIGQLQGVDPFDPNNGYDLSISAEGEGMNRRYNSLSWFPVACPLNLPAGTAIPNLVEVGNVSFKSYQETINILKKKYGQLMLQLGYTVPGDMVGQTYQNVSFPTPPPPQYMGGGHETAQNTMPPQQFQQPAQQFPPAQPLPQTSPVWTPPQQQGGGLDISQLPVQPVQPVNNLVQNVAPNVPGQTGQAPGVFNNAEEFAQWQAQQEAMKYQQQVQQPMYPPVHQQPYVPPTQQQYMGGAPNNVAAPMPPQFNTNRQVHVNEQGVLVYADNGQPVF